MALFGRHLSEVHVALHSSGTSKNEIHDKPKHSRPAEVHVTLEVSPNTPDRRKFMSLSKSAPSSSARSNSFQDCAGPSTPPKKRRSSPVPARSNSFQDCAGPSTPPKKRRSSPVPAHSTHPSPSTFPILHVSHTDTTTNPPSQRPSPHPKLSDW